MLSTDLQLSLLHAKVGNLEFSSVIITFTCQSMKSGIFKCNVSTFTCQRMKSGIFKCDLQLSLLHAKVGNLEFSNVMLSTDLQLSLLHAKE